MEITVAFVVLAIYALIEIFIRLYKNRRNKTPSLYSDIDDLHPSKYNPKEVCLKCSYTKGCPHFASLEYDAGYSCMSVEEYIGKYGDR